MGANFSSQSIESTTEIISNSLTDISTKITNQTNVSLRSDQRINVIFRGVIGCGFNVSQKAKLTGSIMMNNTAGLANDVSNAIKASLKESLNNELAQANKGINLGALNMSNAEMVTDAYIETNLENIIETELRNMIEMDATGIQQINLTFEDIKCSPGESINISQDMLIEMVAKNISTTLVNNAIKNVLDTGIDKELKNKADQLNKGLDFGLFGIITAVVMVAGLGVYSSMSPEEKQALYDAAKKRGGMQYIPYDGRSPMTGIYDGGSKKSSRRARRKLREMEEAETQTIMRYSLGAIVIIVLFYFFYYLPEQQKIKDTYDTSYLYKNKK